MEFGAAVRTIPEADGGEDGAGAEVDRPARLSLVGSDGVGTV